LSPVRHLSRALAEGALRRGRGIEQLLSEGVDVGQLKWVAIASRRQGGYALTIHHVLDQGTPSFFDVHEFAPVDAEEPIGEGRSLGMYDAAAVAIAAAEELGASPDRWVNQGVIADEYKDATG